MYMEKPADLFIEHAEIQFRSNFSGMNGYHKPNPGDPLKRDLKIKIHTLEEAEQLSAIGWPIEINFRGPKMDSREEQKAYTDKVKELLKKNCTNYDERKAFLIERGEFNTECCDFYIKANVSYKYENSAPLINMVMPLQKKVKEMTELNVGTLDNCRIMDLTVTLRLSWSMNLQRYMCYLKSANVVIEEDPTRVALSDTYSDFTVIGAN